MGEYSETGALIRGYVYPPGSAYTSDPVALKTPVKTAGQPTGYDYSYYQNDHLGTPQRLMQKSGVTVWQGEYDAFGAVDEMVSHVQNPLRFPGQYYDKETNLHYNYFRYYDPRTGRYMTSDPIGLDGGLNLFVYVNSNPLGFTDPTGLIPTWIIELAYEIGCYAAQSRVDKYAQEWKSRAQDANKERERAREAELNASIAKCQSMECESKRSKCLNNAFKRSNRILNENFDQLQRDLKANPYALNVCSSVRFPGTGPGQ